MHAQKMTPPRRWPIHLQYLQDLQKFQVRAQITVLNMVRGALNIFRRPRVIFRRPEALYRQVKALVLTILKILKMNPAFP